MRVARAPAPDDLSAIRDILAILEETASHLRARLVSQGKPQPDAELATMASQEVRDRARRARFFEARLFCDPAWDMLLDLYVQEAAGRTVSVSSLCMAAFAPPTTALRWIGALEEAGLVVRAPGLSDRRRVFMRLSPMGTAAMTAYLEACRSDALLRCLAG